MFRQLTIISLVFSLALAGRSFAEDLKGKVKGPITVTAERLTADNKAHTALFEKNVLAKTSDMSMAADKMLIFYKEDGGEVTKIDASGNVRLFRESRAITAENAVYFADEEKVIFSGEPKVIDGDNVVTGSKMTYYIKTDISQVENSRVILKNRKGK